MKAVDRFRRLLLLAAACVAGTPVPAQLFNFGLHDRTAPRVVATACQRPAAAVVGQPCAIVLTLEIDQDHGIDDLRVGGLPDEDGTVVYGTGFDTLADEPAAEKGRILKRFRLPVRFLAPQTNRLALTVQGMMITRRQRGAMSFSSSQSFQARTQPFPLAVHPLPETGKPATFGGAVGTRFALSQTLAPARVHPGDLVTATYTLTFDGHCPTNVRPRLTPFSDAFKTYEIKETKRTDRSIVWTQMLVPRTPEAVRSAHLSLDYYDISAGLYRTCDAPPATLVFLSQEAASTENTAVVVNADAEKSIPSAPNGAAPLTLRFAPSDASPVLAIVPPGTPVTERARTKTGWRRLETPHATGWSRP